MPASPDRLTLTAKGRRLVHRAQQRHHRVLAGLLGEVTTRDLHALRRLLDRLRSSATARSAAPPRATGNTKARR